jgi:hypothetical protein
MPEYLQKLYELEKMNPPPDVAFLTSEQMGELLGNANPFRGPGLWKVKQGEWPCTQKWQWEKVLQMTGRLGK